MSNKFNSSKKVWQGLPLFLFLPLPLFRLSEALQRIFSGRAQIRGEQLDLERQLKENELRQRYCEEDNLQVQYFCAKEKTEKVLMLTLLSTDSNIPTENQLLSHHFTALFSKVVFTSHLRHNRERLLLPSSLLFESHFNCKKLIFCIPSFAEWSAVKSGVGSLKFDPLFWDIYLKLSTFLRENISAVLHLPVTIFLFFSPDSYLDPTYFILFWRCTISLKWAALAAVVDSRRPPVSTSGRSPAYARNSNTFINVWKRQTCSSGTMTAGFIVLRMKSSCWSQMMRPQR